MCLKMFSSTTMASSMTMPTASVSASSVMLFSVKSIARISVKVAMIEAEMASAKINTARTLRMKAGDDERGQQTAPEQVLFERRDRGVDEARSSVVVVSRTPRGNVWRMVARRAFTTSVTRMVNQTRAPHIEGCTAGVPSFM